MLDPVVGPLVGEAALREAHTLFRAAMHRGPMSGDQWEFVRDSFEPGRTLGAFVGDRLVGTALAWSSDLVVSGAVLPMAAVTRVAVRADHRRRGVLRALMGAQLAQAAAGGEVLAGLRAAEPGVYGRFGYGVCGWTHDVEVRPGPLRADAPVGGVVRVLGRDEMGVLPALYERVGRDRVGSMGRPRAWWRTTFDRAVGVGETVVAAVVSVDGLDDGYAVWLPRHGVEADAGAVLEVKDFVAGSGRAAAGLWRFLLGVDLVDRVRVVERPVDDPVAAMVSDARRVRVTGVREGLWLRLVDVPAALAGRRYGAGAAVVVQVEDAMVPANAGRYRISADGVGRTDAEAAVAVDAEVLAMLYLGGWRWRVLAEVGRVRVRDAAAPAALDRLFAVDGAPWCGTYF